MEAFHHAIAFRVVEGREDQLSAHQQPQPHDFAQHAWMASAAAETTIIVHLLVSGEALFLPHRTQELTSVVSTASGILPSAGITGDHINGIETGHRYPTGEVARQNIGLVQLLGASGTQVRIIHGRRRNFVPQFDHARSTQFALDAADAG